MTLNLTLSFSFKELENCGYVKVFFTFSVTREQRRGDAKCNKNKIDRNNLEDQYKVKLFKVSVEENNLDFF